MRFKSQKKYFKLLRNPEGNTVIVVLCLMATSIAAFQISLSHSLAINNNIKNSRILSARDALHSHIKTYSTLGTTFRSSMHPSLPITINSELRNCILGTGASLCQAGVKTPVALYYPISSTTITPNTPLQRISGPGEVSLSGAESATYDNKGNLCAVTAAGTVDPHCPFFEVTTTFIATCAGGASSCVTAESLSVSYVIKPAPTFPGSSSSVALQKFPLATIELAAPAVLRADILPSVAGASANNITISLLPTTTTLTLESIKSTLLTLGMTDTVKIDAMAVAFQQTGITDLSKLGFLVEVGHADSTWMKLLVESGITNAFLGDALYYTNNPWTPALLAATVAAVSGLPDGPISYTIAKQMVTDPVVVTQIVSSVSSISDPYIAAGLIMGGYNTDPIKIQAISTAVSQIPVPNVAGYLARWGITDSTLANQLSSIVSVVTSPIDAGNIINAGGGDLAATQAIVNNYVLTGSLPSTSTTMASSTSSTTTSTFGSSSSSTTGSSSTPSPLEISLMPTCLTCSPVTY